MKGTFTKMDTPQARHRDKVKTIRQKKQDVVTRQRTSMPREKAERKAL